MGQSSKDINGEVEDARRMYYNLKNILEFGEWKK